MVNVRDIFVEVRAKSGIDPNLANIGKHHGIQAKVETEFRPEFGQICSKRAQCCAISANKIGRFGRCWPMMAEAGLALVGFGTKLAEFGRLRLTLADVGRMRSKVGLHPCVPGGVAQADISKKRSSMGAK